MFRRVQQAGHSAVLLGVFAVFAVVVGCAQTRPYDELWVQPRAYQAELKAARPPAAALAGDEAASASASTTATNRDNPTGELTLHEAVAVALRQNPELRAAGWAVGAAEADALQMGRPPNPRLGLMSENLGGDAPDPYFQRQTLRLSQVIELGGKRAKRLALGRATQRLRAWDYEAQRIEVAARAASRYVAVVVAQERVALAEQQLKLAESGYRIAEDRVKAGAGAKQARDQASTRVALSRITVERERRQLDAARADLAAVWGADAARFERAAGGLAVGAEAPEPDLLKQRLADSPAVQRWADEIARRQRDVELQRAKAVPDPTIGGGFRYFNDADDAAGLVELSVPLQAFDDNRHAVLAARLRVGQARAQQDQARAQAAQTLARALARYQSAAYALAALDGEALPASESSYDAAAEAYQAGAVDYLNVLDAERTLLEVRNARLDALLEYHQAVIDIEQVTAHPLETPAGSAPADSGR